MNGGTGFRISVIVYKYKKCSIQHNLRLVYFGNPEIEKFNLISYYVHVLEDEAMDSKYEIFNLRKLFNLGTILHDIYYVCIVTVDPSQTKHRTCVYNPRSLVL